jgi:hypothetical protein
MTGFHSLQDTVKRLEWLSSCFLVGLGCSTAPTAPPAAADTVYNLGYWNNTGGDLVIGVVVATERGDTLMIRSSDRGLSVYARR